MTLDEFESLRDDGLVHELNRGEQIVSPPPKSGHSRVSHRLQRALLRAPEAVEPGEVFIETGYLLSREPPTVRQPDLSYQQTADEDWFEGGPELAVEVVSLSDSAQELAEKVEQCLAAGSRVVWVVYPKTRRVYAHGQDGAVAVLGPEQALEAPDLFPGWSMPVSELFA